MKKNINDYTFTPKVKKCSRSAFYLFLQWDTMPKDVLPIKIYR